MSHLPNAIKEQLREVAESLVDGFSARGHAITTATEADPAFENGAVVSATRRSLAMDEARSAASRIGLDPRSISGGLDLRSFDDVTERRFRLRSANRDSAGELKVVCSSDSALAIDTDDVASLLATEQWVLAMIYGDEKESIEEIVAARVVGRTSSLPGYLLLADEHRLLGGTTPPSTGGFIPPEEPIDLGDDDAGQTGVNRDAS